METTLIFILITLALTGMPLTSLSLSPSSILLGIAASQRCVKSDSYNINEGPTGNRCTNECDCTGTRSCSPSGFCQYCVKSSSYNIDEARNSLAANRCQIDCQCTGTRRCSAAGWCN